MLRRNLAACQERSGTGADYISKYLSARYGPAHGIDSFRLETNELYCRATSGCLFTMKTHKRQVRCRVKCKAAKIPDNSTRDPRSQIAKLRSLKSTWEAQISNLSSP